MMLSPTAIPVMLRNSDFGQPLHDASTSPVRGQLEPQQPGTRSGWRYIQCTDTPNELKVLLPPKTALLYGQLLKAELTALADPRFIDWTRLIEIRHLKDRMMRKCTRLSKAWAAPRQSKDRHAFLAIPAPDNFRLKELEKWIKSEEQRLGTVSSQKVPTTVPVETSVPVPDAKKAYVCCERCSRALSHRASSAKLLRRSSRSTVSSTHRHSHSSQPRATHSSSTIQTATLNDPRLSPLEDEFPIHPEEAIHHHLVDQHVHEEQYHIRSSSSREIFGQSGPLVEEPEETTFSLRDTSPDPLPHPYRHRDSMEISRAFASHTYTDQSDIPSVNLPPISEIPSEGENVHSMSRPIPLRRRSSLKQANSTFSSTPAKAVAWAMDKDLVEQMSKRDAAAGEVVHADNEWEEMRLMYLKQMSGLQNMRQNVTVSLDRLRFETDRLQREEGAMRQEEDRLRDTYEQLEKKQAQYRAKVKVALEESHHVVSLCTTKREADFGAT